MDYNIDISFETGSFVHWPTYRKHVSLIFVVVIIHFSGMFEKNPERAVFSKNVHYRDVKNEQAMKNGRRKKVGGR